MVRLAETKRLSSFMQVWKNRSGRELNKFVRGQLRRYVRSVDRKQAFWQPKYYRLNLYAEKKAL